MTLLSKNRRTAAQPLGRRQFFYARAWRGRCERVKHWTDGTPIILGYHSAKDER